MDRSSLVTWQTRSKDLFELLELVGAGTFGKVYKAKYKGIGENYNCTNTTNNTSNTNKNDTKINPIYSHKKLYALKYILMTNEREGFPVTAMREIALLRRMNHDNIIGLKEVLSNNSNKEHYLVFDYMEHDLSGLIEKQKQQVNIPLLKYILFSILKGLDYMHSMNILHRDIKSSNILISKEGEIKIADFGLSRSYNPHVNNSKYNNSNNSHSNSIRNLTNKVITLWYRPPELLLGSTRYDSSIDMWSTGCVFSEMLIGRPPFRGTKEKEQLDYIFEKCGTPNAETWLEAIEMKNYSELAPTKKYPNQLKNYYLDNKK